jgi:hypothetical protein
MKNIIPKHVIKKRVFCGVLGSRHFLGGTLGCAGHLLAPTVSEASEEGRTDDYLFYMLQPPPFMFNLIPLIRSYRR